MLSGPSLLKAVKTNCLNNQANGQTQSISTRNCPTTERYHEHCSSVVCNVQVGSRQHHHEVTLQHSHPTLHPHALPLDHLDVLSCMFMAILSSPSYHMDVISSPDFSLVGWIGAKILIEVDIEGVNWSEYQSWWAAVTLSSRAPLCSAVSAACLSRSAELFLCDLTCLSWEPKLSPAGQQTTKHDGLYLLLSTSLTVPSAAWRSLWCWFVHLNLSLLLSSDPISGSYIQLLSELETYNVEMLHYTKIGQNAYMEYALTI